MNRPDRLPILLFILINCLFVFKYTSRLTSGSLYITVAYAIIAVLALILLFRIPDKYYTKKLLGAFLILYIFAAIFILNIVNIETLNVDRWSVIASFWEAVFDGQFPYTAKSIHNNPPGPFPFYFIISLPFHLFGEIGLMTILAIIGFSYLLFYRSKSYKPTIILILFTATAPALLWEISVRSTIFINMVLVLFYLLWLEYTVNRKFWYQIFTGFVGGLLLSTRGIVVIPYLAFFAFAYLRTKRWHALLTHGFGIIIGFTVTFLPFVIWDYQLFKIYNPIILQAGFLNLPLLIIFFIATIIIGLKSHNTCLFYRNLAFTLIIVITTAFLKTIIQHGWSIAFHSSAFDISYYILAAPFLVVSRLGMNKSS